MVVNVKNDLHNIFSKRGQSLSKTFTNSPKSMEPDLSVKEPASDKPIDIKFNTVKFARSPRDGSLEELDSSRETNSTVGRT